MQPNAAEYANEVLEEFARRAASAFRQANYLVKK